MITHKITYEIIEGSIIPGVNPLMPIIRVFSDSMGYGTVKFGIPYTSKANSITAKIYKVNTPHVDDQRWIRIDNDLFTSSILNFTGRLVNTTEYVIEFMFLPANISGISDKDYYSIEFFVSLNQSIQSIFSPKLIVSIKDRMVTL